MSKAPRLVLVTDPAFDADVIARTVAAVLAAVPGACVQLRDRHASDDAIAPLAERIRSITRARGGSFVVNRRLALAKRVHADGVHVDVADVAAARAEWPLPAIVGSPAHTDEDVAHARAAGASFVLVSPVFASPGKGAPRGTDAIRSARAIAGTDLGVVALGGVTSENARECFEAGADGVAAIRALFTAAEPDAVAARMVAAGLV